MFITVELVIAGNHDTTRWLPAVVHCLTPKHCTVHAAYCVLCAGPVCCLSSTAPMHFGVHFTAPFFFRFSLYTIWPLPDTYPSFVTTLLASWPLPHPKMSCTSYHVLYPFFRTSLLASCPLPHPITFCASYHILYRLTGPFCRPFRHCLTPKCALHITYFTVFSGPIWLPVGHCLTAKLCALRVTYSALFSGPVWLLVVHCLTPTYRALCITYCAPLSGPVCWPVCHCLAPKHCVLHITYCTLLPGPVSRPFGHCLTPKPFALSYHILHPVFRINLLASWPQPNTKTLSTSYHILYPVFRTTLPASWLLILPKQCVLYIVYSTLFSGPVCRPFGHCLTPKYCALITLPCFRDQFACQSATASPQNIVLFISPTVPSFQDQFACPLTTASHIHTYKSENQHSRGISVVSVVGPQ